METHMISLTNPNLLKNQAYIDGQWSNADDGKTFAVQNPFDQSVLTQVADVGVNETKRAIAAAEKAWPHWRNKTAKERAQFLYRWAELVKKNFSDLAKLLTLEQGKPLDQANNEIDYVITLLDWYAAETQRIHGQTIMSPSQEIRFMTVKEPIGVVAAIAPWNFPTIAMQQCIPAIAAGCTVVFKPAQDTPLTILAFAALAEEAKLAPGIFNIVTCENPEAVGNELTTNPVIRKIAFTGSTRVGKQLSAQAAATVKKVSLELGGNCPMIIFADANIEKAVDEAVVIKFYNAGQMCNDVNRFLVEDAIYDDVINRFVAKAKLQKLGSGLDPATTVGPLINEATIAKVDRLVKDAIQQGAIVKLGGQKSAIGKLFYEPTVLSNVPTTAAMYREEIFGPVAAFYRFKTEAEAIKMANDTPYGLAGYFYTANADRARRVCEALENGSIGVNTTSIFAETAPFGGYKESGLAREGGVIDSLDNFCEIKTIATGLVQ